MQRRFEENLRTHSLAQPGARILLAVSGGIDSMVMLDLFQRIRSPWKLTLGIAHLNHCLRGVESDQDEEFVRETAVRRDVPIWTDRADVSGYRQLHGVSKQEAARELRYHFFERARSAMNADLVATAHQADDNAETVLMNALRGAGVRGLSGIPPRREGSIIRPLLFARRCEIERYATDAGIRFREDSSNRLTDSTRNSIRHLLLPSLNRHLQIDTVPSLNRVAESMRSLGEAIQTELRRCLGDVLADEAGIITVTIEALRKLPLYLQEEVAMHVFRQVGVEPTVTKVLAFLALCDHPTGRTLQLSGRWHVLRDRDRLVVHPASDDAATFEHRVRVGHEYTFEEFRFRASRLESVPHRFASSRHSEIVDADLLGENLILRSWRTGDAFVPLGMQNPKKLSDFLVDQKVPLHRKHHTPLLESNGVIVWVCGLRLDNRFRVTPGTTRAVRLEYSPIAQ